MRQLRFQQRQAFVERAEDSLRKGGGDEKPHLDGVNLSPICLSGQEFRRKRGEKREARGQINKLTPREFEVFRFVIMGLLNKQIAAELHTAEKTIKVHRGRVMQKIGVTSVADLVRVSQRAGVSPAHNPA